MTGGDQREPLWADSLADQPRPDYDDVIVHVLVEEPEEDGPVPRRDRRPAGRRSLILALLAGIGFGGLAIAVEGRGALTVEDVPSYWEDVPMTCRTVRLEQEARAVEWFWCRAVGGRSLPAGLYRPPDSQWTSDITRRPAQDSRIRISPDGEVVGWATY